MVKTLSCNGRLLRPEGGGLLYVIKLRLEELKIALLNTVLLSLAEKTAHSQDLKLGTVVPWVNI